MKKSILLLFAALLPLVASAQTKVEIDGIWYNLDESAKQAEVRRSGGTRYSGSITIPATVTHNGVEYSVTSIGNEAFSDCYSLTAITIPESVTSIGGRAFYFCNSLTDITIPENSQLTSIRYEAFYGCSLTAVHISSLEVWCNIDFAESSANPLLYAKNLYLNGGLVKDLTIPNSVTTIKNYAFYNCSSLTAITLPEGVTSIGVCAFSYCSSLTAIIVEEGNEVYDSRNGCNAIIETNSNTLIQGCSTTIIPESVTSIGDYAFYGCSLTAITIPESVTSIGENAFSWCSSLTDITIPEGVTSIGYRAFYECSSLTAITLPESVTSIGGGAFEGCSSLTAITIPEGVTSIGESAFEECSSLTSITIPEGVTSIGNYAFYKCSSLTSITIPEGVTSIGNYAFEECSSLTSITIPEDSKLTSIGSYAFYKCSSLTAITIPEGVTSIGNYAFYNCSSLKTVINYSDLSLVKGSRAYGSVAYYADRVINVDVIDGYAFNTIEGVHYLIGYIGDKTELTLPADYKGENYQIGERAFYNCYSLTTITIPENSQLTSIGEDAFNGCSSLERVTINCANVGSWFSGLSSLKEIVLGESVTSIEYGAFYDCSSLERVTINCANVGSWFSGLSSIKEIVLGASVTSIGYRAFSSCSSLTAISVAEGNTIYDSRGGCNAIIETNSNTLISGCATTIIPEGVTSIGDYAFSGCSSLTAITLPEGVTSIGNWAFYRCSSLTAINIPEGVTSIGDVAFRNCGSLTAITLPEGVTSIGDCAFDGCSSLIAITLPEGVTSIEYGAFYNCSSLTAITIPKGVTSIGESAFDGCSSLTAITLPEGVTSIGDAAFFDCSNLTTIVLPKSVEFISRSAFANCSGLTDVYCYAETVPGTNTDAFDGSDTEYATLHVRERAVESFKSITPWSNFGRFEALKVVVENITLNASTATLIEGEDLTLAVMVTPDDATDKSISWSSSNPSVASVDRGGKVTAIVPGTAIITATANDGSGVSAQCEVTVTPASYVITVLVDGEVILTNTLTRGSTINLPDVPEKEGYTFSGWSEVPETMPAKDVTVSGTFIVNKYLVTFKIGDEVIAADSLAYGATIVAPEAPEKEGHTFSGWGEVAETVPANDVTYSAYYIANVYKVYYFVESKLVNMVEVTYGEPIPEYIYEPTTEGDEFLGWIGETYATMPAHDVIYTANICTDINAMSTDKGQQTIVIYDLHGRRVTNPIKGGIYIINGRKVMIK